MTNLHLANLLVAFYCVCSTVHGSHETTTFESTNPTEITVSGVEFTTDSTTYVPPSSIAVSSSSMSSPSTEISTVNTHESSSSVSSTTVVISSATTSINAESTSSLMASTASPSMNSTTISSHVTSSFFASSSMMTTGGSSSSVSSSAATISSAPTSTNVASTAVTMTSNVTTTITSATDSKVNRTYSYTLSSNSTLRLGVITNATLFNSINRFVNSSFNLNNMSVTLIRAEIVSSNSRAVNSILLTTLTFSAVGNCSDQCFNQSIVPISPTADLQLPDNNGNLITVTARGPPTLASGPTTTPSPQTFTTGEPPPGRAAQLGMGLGITFIGLIVIAEMAFLYKKYGFSSSARASDYELRYTQDYDAS